MTCLKRPVVFDAPVDKVAASSFGAKKMGDKIINICGCEGNEAT